MKYLLAILLITSINVNAQKEIELKGYVLSQSDTLSFSTIEILSKEEGVVTGKNGFFTIKVEPSDTLLIKSMGYKDKKIYDFKKEILNIYLEEDSFSFSEAIISPKTKKILDLGFSKKKAKAGFNSMPGTIRAYHIKNTQLGETTFLKNFKFFIGKGGVVSTPIRIRFFRIDENGIPSKDFFKKEIIVIPNKKNRWYTVDCSEFNLQMPATGICIGLEYIENAPKYFFEEKINTGEIKVKRTSYGNLLGGYWSKENNLTWHRSLGKKWFQINHKINGNTLHLAIKYQLEIIE
jgi:hypothetical protein